MIHHRHPTLFVALLLTFTLHSQVLFGQGSGAAYTGYGSRLTQAKPNSDLDWETATKVITISGTAEIKIKPEKIRLIFAVLAQGQNGKECTQKIKQTQSDFTAASVQKGVKKDDIVRDFIAVIPTYTWMPVEFEKEKMVQQKQSGVRMQSNLHVLCDSEKQAMEVIDIAFEVGINDVIAFDYWSSKSDQAKQEARSLALKAAREKAELMLSVFNEPPTVINVQEKTTLHKPANLYRTFSRNLAESISLPRSWRDRPQISAYRPQMTYLENLDAIKDLHERTPAMNPEISVLSTVKIYYQSPAKPLPKANQK